MFKTYNATFRNNETAELLWDGRDTSCFEIIDHEWPYIFTGIEHCVKQARTVIQAGGNCGLYPLRLSQYFNNVFTFEPDPINFFCLAHNCKNNKIIKFNAALGSKNKFSLIENESQYNNGMPHIIPDSGVGTIIYEMTIDSLSLDNVDLVLLDIEGYELNALFGAEQTLRRCQPAVILEVTDNEHAIDNFMTGLGYKQNGVITGNTKTIAYII